MSTSKSRTRDASAGWQAEYNHQHVETSIEPAETIGRRADRIAAMTREDRPEEYRRKAAMGVTT